MRHGIVRSSVELIGEIGWSRVTTRKVAERAGVNNALIHYYFGSKENLLREAVISLFTEEFEGPLSSLIQAEDIVTGIDHLFTAIGELDVTQVRLIALSEAMLQGLRDDVIRSWTQQVLDETTKRLAEQISRDQRAGRVRSDLDPGGAALVIVGLIDALVLYRFNHPTLDLEPPRRAIHTMLKPEETER
jgi:AcrR family transcriptional regulator